MNEQIFTIDAVNSTTVLVGFITALAGTALGAFIGTRCASKFIQDKKEEKNIKLRNLAISALQLFKRYAKEEKTFKSVEEEFNNDFNISKKRIFLVLLHKLGIPILLLHNKSFDIKKIEFSEEKIDKDMLDEMIEQVKSGYCDNLFYIDIDKYYSEELILKTRRDIALKYIDNCMCDIEIREDNALYLKDGWHKNFSEGELNTILVFKAKNSSSLYYLNGKVNYEEINRLKEDVKKGLWDQYLNWDFDAYNNMITQKNAANLVSQVIQSQQAVQQQALFSPELLEQLITILPQQLAQLQAKTSQQEENNDTK